MTRFEHAYLLAQWCLPAIHRRVRRELICEVRSCGYRPTVLDVGGRKSHYTIGIPADITVTDLPRESRVQHDLHLGLNRYVIDQLYERRTNICRILFDDMSCSMLPDSSFDYIVSVEVLEHVERDVDFVRHVCRVLKPGGVFIMTTPNGDHHKAIVNPDHKRHYTRRQLSDLLHTCFDEVRVEYAVRSGLFHQWGLWPWSFHHPIRTALSVLGNIVNNRQSSSASVKRRAVGTQHLLALARKAQ